LTFIILKTTLSNNREEIHLNTRIKNEEKRTNFWGPGERNREKPSFSIPNVTSQNKPDILIIIRFLFTPKETNNNNNNSAFCFCVAFVFENDGQQQQTKE